MKNFKKLDKIEMKMIVGGDTRLEAGGCGTDMCQSDSDCSGTAGFPHCRTSHCGAGSATVKFCGI